MTVLLVHLSDIHIKDSSDIVFSRIAHIAAAVNSRKEDASLTLLVISGDVALYGKADQYLAARTFIDSLRERIDGDCSTAVVPGNHDCDFAFDNSARRMAMSGLLQTPTTPIDSSLIDVLTEVQKPFFSFRDDLDSGALENPSAKAFYKYRFTVDQCAISVRCANTAWMSRIKENAGSLFFPASLVPQRQEDEFSITMFHHPQNWLTPTSKSFIKAAEDTSDLILTGHEHDHDRSVKYKPDTGDRTSYIAAGALQDSDSDAESGFNVLLVDVSASRQKFYHFVWKSDQYESTTDASDWEPLALASQRMAESFSFTSVFEASLRDAGIPPLSRGDKERTFDDFFVYPDLREARRDLIHQKPAQSISSAQAFEELAKHNFALLTGEPKSGRTALARKLLSDYHAGGFVPIYCDTLDGLRAEPGIPQALVVKAKAQYGNDAGERFRQLDARMRVLIVDNVERSAGRVETRRQVVEQLCRVFGHVILIGDDTAGKVMELAPALDAGPDVGKAFRIQPLGHVLMELLAQRWFSKNDGDDDQAHSLRLDEAAKTLSTIMGRNYIPAYPIYVISVLQAIEDGVGVNVNVSTHGYFYEILIKSALAVKSAPEEVSLRIEFLTHLAYEMFSANKLALLEADLQSSFERYQVKYEIGGLRYEHLIDSLVDRGMLVRESDVVRFRYPYLFFYFVANSLKKLASAQTRAQVEALATDLNNERSSDIMMFLVHLGHDSFVIEQIMKAAAAFFPADAPAALDSATGDDDEVTLEYVELPQDEARIQAAATKDRQIAVVEKNSTRPNGAQREDTGRTFSAALHTIRLVGQILRSYPGAIEGGVKADLVRASCALGLRTLSAATRIIEAGKEATIQQVINEVRRAYPHIHEDRIRAKAARYLEFLNRLTAFGLIRIVASSIAAQRLEPTYRRVFRDEPSPAMQLIRASINMEYSSSFPSGTVDEIFEAMSGRHEASFLLKALVLEHFQRIFVDQRTRQRVCAKLSIKYTVPLVSNPKYKAVK
jgi:predicted MPP superfamily phosphohydrolase